MFHYGQNEEFKQSLYRWKMVIKIIDDKGVIYYKHFDDYDKYLKELKALNNEESLYETTKYNNW